MLSLGFLADAQQGAWQTIYAGSPVSGGLSEAIVGADDAIYILRAHQSDDPLSFWRCPIQQTVWCTAEPLIGLPDAETQAKGVFQNGTAMAWEGSHYIYALVGGFYDHRGRTGFWRYDTCLNQPSGCLKQWQDLASTPGEQGPGNALTYVRFQDQDYIYAFIGASTNQRSGAFNAFVRYDISLNQWSDDFPEPWDCTDDGASLAWDGGRFLYALHGSNCRDNATPDFARYDLTSNSWENLPNVPERVNDGGSLVYLDGILYVLVGGDSSSTSSFAFDAESRQWLWGRGADPDLPCPIGYWVGNRLAVVKGELFAWQGAPSTWECGGDALMRYLQGGKPT
jgi:hypothetical protein